MEKSHSFYFTAFIAFLLSGLITLSSSLSAAPSQVEFVAPVNSIELFSSQVGLLHMGLTPDFELTVRVTGTTEIRDGASQLTLQDLAAGMVLRIEGLYTSEGILAQEIEVTEASTDFEIRARISAIDSAARTLTVAGLIIQVLETTEIMDSKGVLLAFEDLETNQFARVEGMAAEAGLTATRVTIRAEGGGFAHLNFEGIVTAINDEDSTLLVEIAGVGPALVIIAEDTVIHGNLRVGALVRVIGVLTAELATRARRILVKELLQLAPSRLEMQTEQTRRVEVILRSPLDQDLLLAIVSQDPGLAVPSTSSLTIPAGKVVGFFEVTAGMLPGETSIDVTTPAELGAFVTSLPVRIRQQGGGPGSGPSQQIQWIPPQLNLKPGQTRSMHLQLRRPAESLLTAQLSLTVGDAGLVLFPETVSFDPGTRTATVELQMGNTPGDAEIEASLPEGVHAQLKIRIRDKKP